MEDFTYLAWFAAVAAALWGLLFLCDWVKEGAP